MALQKSIVSARTGVTLTYHEVFQVSVSGDSANILVASYPDKAAKDAKKQFTDMTPVSAPYAQEAMPSGVFAWAQAVVLANPTFAGAVEV